MKYRPRAHGHYQAAIRPLRERRDRPLDLAGIAHVDCAQLYAQGRRRSLDYAELTRSGRNGRFSNDRDPRHAGRNLFEQLQPFRSDAVFEHDKSGGIAARPREAIDVTGTDRVGNSREHDGNAARRLQQGGDSGAGIRQDDVRAERDQFRRVFANSVGVGDAPAAIDADVAAVEPAQLREPLEERRYAGLKLRIVSGAGHQHADTPYALALLRPRSDRPGGRAAEQRDERAASHHSITSSARASIVVGTSRPSVLAVLRLSTSSYLVGACTGRSPGFSPLRMRSTYPAARRNWSTKSGP